MATESSTKETTSEHGVERGGVERSTVRFFLLWGTAVGATEAVAFRLVGHYLLNPANEVVLAGVFVATIPAMILLTYPVYAWRGVTGAERQAASVLYVLPLMMFDVVALADFGVVYPNMAGAANYFGTVVLLGFTVVLITGFVPRDNDMFLREGAAGSG